MKILLLFTLLLLVGLGAVSTAQVLAKTHSSDMFDSSAKELTASIAGSEPYDPAVPEATSSTTSSFTNRFETLEKLYTAANKGNDFQNSKPSPDFGRAIGPTDTDYSCVPKVPNQQKFGAYGFHTLSATSGITGTPVNFNVFSRTQYYALTPHWTGNIDIPEHWTAHEVTEAAHRQGSRVDLVISNRNWFYDGGQKGDAGYKFDGLWLTKSYVVLTLIDDIADAVEKYNFDGVTIDFRLPNDIATAQSYAFFLDRLKTRLDADAETKKDTDLLDLGDKQLNIVIDQIFAKRLAESYRIRTIRNGVIESLPVKPDDDLRQEFNEQVQELTEREWARLIEVQDAAEEFSDSEPIGISGLINDQRNKPRAVEKGDSASALTTLISELPEKINLLFYDEDVEKEVGTAISELDKPKTPWPGRAVILPDTNSYSSDSYLTAVGIWDIPDADPASDLKDEVFAGINGTRHTGIPGFVCTNRDIITKTLAGSTLVLSLLVLVSWVFNDFPPRIERFKWLNRSNSNLVIWGLLAVSALAFILLLIGIPSLNFKSIYLYIILAGFVIPLVSLIWIFGNKVGEKTYP